MIVVLIHKYFGATTNNKKEKFTCEHKWTCVCGQNETDLIVVMGFIPIHDLPSGE